MAHTALQVRLGADIICKVLSQLASLSLSALLVPVTEQQVPGDLSMNQRLMDLGTIQDQLADGAYSTAGVSRGQIICKALSQLSGLKKAGPFLAPVTAQQAPGYLSTIKCPMDLRTIQEQLADGAYSSAGAFKVSCSGVLSQLASLKRSCAISGACHRARGAWVPQRPMDLGTIQEQLADGAYSSAGAPWGHITCRVLSQLVSMGLFVLSVPVTEQQAPGYLSVIQRPINLGTIQEHLFIGAYSSAGVPGGCPVCELQDAIPAVWL